MKRERLTKDYILKYLKESELFFFTLEEFSHFFQIKSNYAAQIILKLKKMGGIKEVEKGKYILNEAKVEPFLIGCRSVLPSYISFKTALFIHNLLEEENDAIYIATPKRKAPLDFRSFRFKYVTLKPYKFFGFADYFTGETYIKVALPEKAFIDSLDELDYGPDFNDLLAMLKIISNKFSVARLVKYAIRMKDKSLIARLGYLLEEIGIEVHIPEEFLPKDYVKLVPSEQRRGKWNQNWMIIDNR